MPPTKQTRRSRPARTAPPARRFPVVAVVVGLVLILALAAIVIGTTTGSDDDDGAGTDVAAGIEQRRDVQIAGSPLEAYAAGGQDEVVGKAAPTATGQSFDGDEVTIGGRGPQVIVFLAHWCPHCRKEVPLIADWIARKGKPQGVEFKAVSTNTDSTLPNYPPSAWLERETWPLETLADDARSTTASAFGLSSFPYFVAIDASGNVTKRAAGELTISQLEELIDSARGTAAAAG